VSSWRASGSRACRRKHRRVGHPAHPRARRAPAGDDLAGVGYLNIFVRFGLNSCGAEIRRELVWLRPTHLVLSSRISKARTEPRSQSAEQVCKKSTLTQETVVSEIFPVCFQRFPVRCKKFPVRLLRELDRNALKLERESGPQPRRTVEFPEIRCFFPVSREMRRETGPIGTASATTQSCATPVSRRGRNLAVATGQPSWWSCSTSTPSRSCQSPSPSIQPAAWAG
jgi:hypothetical protein